MYYPAGMTADDIMEFEFELNRQIDIERNKGQFWVKNGECQVVADEQRDYADGVEDDDYVVTGCNDSWYEDQYELDDCSV